MNEKLIRDMMKCDGTLKNCEGCMFADNPECRNAMAHNGGAVIQLQEVVIANQATTIRGWKTKVAERDARLKAVDEVREKLNRVLMDVTNDLKANRNCATCGHQTQADNLEICAKCKAVEDSSMWELDDRYFGEEEQPETEEDDVTEIE